jgi:hypothetical protein
VSDTYRVRLERWVLERGDLYVRAASRDDAILAATQLAHADLDPPEDIIHGPWHRDRVVRVRPFLLAEVVTSNGGHQ